MQKAWPEILIGIVLPQLRVTICLFPGLKENTELVKVGQKTTPSYALFSSTANIVNQ
jgi:hypothetical protein